MCACCDHFVMHKFGLCSEFTFYMSELLCHSGRKLHLSGHLFMAMLLFVVVLLSDSKNL